jgi:hypothetical protein
MFGRNLSLIFAFGGIGFLGYLIGFVPNGTII